MPTSSSASRRPTCSTSDDIAADGRGRHRLRAGQPRPRGRPGGGAAACGRRRDRTIGLSRTRSTTCSPSPASSADCSTRRPLRSRTRCSWPPRKAIAATVSDDELNANYVIPSVFHEEVHKAVAAAVKDAALAAGSEADGCMSPRAAARRHAAAGRPELRPHRDPAARPRRRRRARRRDQPAVELPLATVLPDWSDAGDRAARCSSAVDRSRRVRSRRRLVAPGDGAGRQASGRWPVTSAWSTSTPTRRGGSPTSSGCGCSPATPAGAPASSRRRSKRGPGTSSRRCPTTCSTPTRNAVARRAAPPGRGARLCRHLPRRPHHELAERAHARHMAALSSLAGQTRPGVAGQTGSAGSVDVVLGLGLRNIRSRSMTDQRSPWSRQACR